MKSLRQLVELKKIDLVPDPELQAGTVSNYANPKSDAERRFVEKHVDSIQKTLHPAFKNEAEQKAVFSGTVEKDKTHDNAGAGHYQDGEDASRNFFIGMQVFVNGLDINALHDLVGKCMQARSN